MERDPSDQIPEIKLIPKPMTGKAKNAMGFKWAGEEIGKRHKIGGEPDLLQPLDVLKCDCGNPMAFYAQLDSIGDD